MRKLNRTETKALARKLYKEIVNAKEKANKKVRESKKYKEKENEIEEEILKLEFKLREERKKLQKKYNNKVYGTLCANKTEFYDELRALLPYDNVGSVTYMDQDVLRDIEDSITLEQASYKTISSLEKSILKQFL